MAVAILTPTSVAADTPEDVDAQAGSGWIPAAPVPLQVSTRGGVPVDSREEYVDATMLLDGVTREVEIRGRGNSTWWWPKKPYKLNLADPAALVGRAPHDEWVLLANYADRSALRTAAAFAVASRTRLAWTPKSRFVEVTLNGQALGLYLLTEQVEQGRSRVEFADNGYLLEINERYARDDEPGFRSRRGTPVAFKDPDEVTRRQVHQVRRGVRKFEDVLYGQDFADPRTGYRAYVDVASFVDWYLVEELFGNQDSDFRSSVNLSWTPGGRFVMGPVWDFDLSAGSRWFGAVPPVGWHTRKGTHWIARMFQDPAFSAQVDRRWDRLRPIVDEVVAQIPAAAERLRATAEADWLLWHTGDGARPGSRHADSFSGEVGFLRDWLTQRSEWLSRPQAVLGQVPVTVPERSRTVWIPVRLTSSRAESTAVDYEWLAGTATRNVDFTMPDGRLDFAPGQTERFIPVTIAADTETEGAETIGIRLRGASGGVVVGSPDQMTVTVGASDQPVDAMIRRPRDPVFLGDDVVNRTGVGQTIETMGPQGARRVFLVRVVNDGNVRNTVRLHGTPTKRALRVRYLRGGRNVTAKLTGADGSRVRLAPGQARQVRMIVTVRRSAHPGTRPDAEVRAVWAGDERRVDTVRAVVRVRR